MSGLYTYQTTFVFSLGDSSEQELHARIRYRVQPGYPDTLEEPGCASSVELASIAVQSPSSGIWEEVPGWLWICFEGDKSLTAELLADSYDADEYARDQAADAKREERMLERGR